MNRDREITRKYVQHAEARGVKGLFITVDAPQLGRREKDMRMKAVDDNAGAEVQKGQDVKKDQGVARAISVGFAEQHVSAWHDREVWARVCACIVVHRSEPLVEGHPLVQEHHQECVFYTDANDEGRSEFD